MGGQRRQERFVAEVWDKVARAKGIEVGSLPGKRGSSSDNIKNLNEEPLPRIERILPKDIYESMIDLPHTLARIGRCGLVAVSRISRGRHEIYAIEYDDLMRGETIGDGQTDLIIDQYFFEKEADDSMTFEDVCKPHARIGMVASLLYFQDMGSRIGTKYAITQPNIESPSNVAELYVPSEWEMTKV